MHRSCVPASRSTRKAFTLASWFPPSHPMQIRFSDLQVLVFEQSMCHAASPTTHCLSPVADHSTRLISPRHRKPPCCHPSATLRQAEGLYRRALSGREDQLGPEHPDTLTSARNLAILLEVKGSVAEARGVSVESTCVVAWGGSAWRGCQGGKLVEVEEDKKWFNSDAFLKGDLTSLGKSVVKIRKMMFYSVFFL